MVIGLPSTGIRNSWARMSDKLVAQRQPAAEHKSIASIVLESEDPSLDGLIGGDAVGPVETAHRRVEEAKRVRHPIGSRRVYCAELVEAGLGEIRLLSGQHCFSEDLRLARRCDPDRSRFRLVPQN